MPANPLNLPTYTVTQVDETGHRAIAPEVATAFQPVVTALGNWEPEIMAYFRHQITNAYTESLNSLIRVTNRMGRGYSFEALGVVHPLSASTCRSALRLLSPASEPTYQH